MKKVIYDKDGRFVASVRADIDLGDAPFIEVDDELATSLTTEWVCSNGEWAHTPVVLTLSDAQSESRRYRDTLLSACDWTQLPDVAPATQAAWKDYRQALREVTEQPDQFAIVWPTPPIK